MVAVDTLNLLVAVVLLVNVTGLFVVLEEMPAGDTVLPSAGPAVLVVVTAESEVLIGFTLSIVVRSDVVTMVVGLLAILVDAKATDSVVLTDGITVVLNVLVALTPDVRLLRLL